MTNTMEKPLPFDPVAFTAALIGGPLLVTVVTCWLIIPIFALGLGGPLYLVVGTPVLLWMVGRYPPEFGRFAWAGMAAIFVLLCLSPVIQLALPKTGAVGAATFLVFGFAFAPFWSGTFAYLYRRFNRMARLSALS